MLFKETIDGWDSWGRVYQSREAFSPLAEEICRINGLPFAPLVGLTPGTNAVFRVGDMVLKILAPAESGISPEWSELFGLRHAQSVGVSAPRVLASGILRDRYDFFYMALEYLEGREMKALLPEMGGEARRGFAGELRRILARLNVPAAPDLPDSIAMNALANARWKIFPASLLEAVREAAGRLRPEEFVFVHGDLFDENVLMDARGKLFLIDFGDCHRAPLWYEWTPVIFGLFHRDRAMTEAFFADRTGEEVLEGLTDSLLLHDFGGDYVRELCETCGVAPETLRSRDDLRALVKGAV